MGRRRIMVVDDCSDTLELLKTTLEEHYEVYGIQEPARALDALEIAEPDAVILDLMMPGKSGFDILDEAAESTPTVRNTPIIVLSCKRSVDAQKTAYAKGAKLYFSKPFDPDRLLRLLAMFFDGAEIPSREKHHKLIDVDRLVRLRASAQIRGIRGSQRQAPATPYSPGEDELPNGSDEDEEAARGKKERGPERWLN